MDGDKILIGKIVGIHGLKGTVKVLSYAESPHNFQDFDTILLTSKGESQELQVESANVRGKLVMLSLSQISSRSEAELIVGAEVYVKPESLSKSEGEYFWYQIIGLTVQLEDGRVLGKVEAILPTGSNDVYVVRNGSKEYLIPAIKDVVLEIDLSKGVITIRLLNGLLNEE